MHITLANPRGFCAGVERAIDIVNQALQKYGAPIYVFHEIVHNRHVVEDLRQRGAVFVEAITDIPAGGVCIFSAHGVAKKVVTQAQQHHLNIIDATCPLVTKVHAQLQRYHQTGHELIIIGHRGHPEVEGVQGQVNARVHVLAKISEVADLSVKTPDKLAYVTQTTLSVDDTQDMIKALKQRFPKIQGPDINDICYATQNRQNAVKQLATAVDVLLVVGAPNSSNSNRLREKAAQTGIHAYLVADASEVQAAWFADNRRVGVTAGASAPEILVQQVIDYLEKLPQVSAITALNEMAGEPETIRFKLPPF
jgi:4-hydroxy-3-methylbut-2-enyl diphosphate reductase